MTLYVVMKNVEPREGESSQRAVCAFYERDKAERRVAELMDARTEKCSYEVVEAEAE